MTVLTKIFYWKNTENELKNYHKKTNWANVVWMQDSWMLLKSDRFHDTRYCRILTIHRCGGLSWVHSAKRRRNIWTERLDQREHQNWARIRSYNLLLTEGKYGVEIRIMSLSKDNSHSWVRISQGLNKLVTNLNNNEQEISDVQVEEYAFRLNASDFASPIKG